MKSEILAWFGTASVLIGLVVRLLKSDTPLPTVPARLRPWLALALGVVAGVAKSAADGMPLSQAIVAGLGSAVAAMTAHDLVVESVMKGKEPFSGGGGGPALALLFAGYLSLHLMACAAVTPKRVNAIERRIECVLEHRSLPPEQVAVLCALESPSDVVDIVTGEDRRIGSARAIGEAQGRILSCAPPAKR